VAFNLNYFKRRRKLLNPRHCVHPVHDALGVGFHQCSRRPARTLGGFDFCEQHFKMVAHAEYEYQRARVCAYG